MHSHVAIRHVRGAKDEPARARRRDGESAVAGDLQWIPGSIIDGDECGELRVIVVTIHEGVAIEGEETDLDLAPLRPRGSVRRFATQLKDVSDTYRGEVDGEIIRIGNDRRGAKRREREDLHGDRTEKKCSRIIGVSPRHRW